MACHIATVAGGEVHRESRHRSGHHPGAGDLGPEEHVVELTATTHDFQTPGYEGKIDGEVFAGDIRVPPAGNRTTKAILLKKERKVRRPRDDGTWTTATGHR